MNQLKEIINNPSTVIVDVRSSWEFESEHVPGAQNIPLEEIPYKVEEFKNLGKPLVLYCRSGNRSGMGVTILKQKGVTEVYNGGGLSDVQILLN
ncbi:MAG: rhodanese-like domain-containing protein [Chitinophagaceae bacterium]|nr:rhodanese-like domain-containing protein [Chitinophagaceae bacterium]